MNVLPFQPYQIVYVECHQTRLYAEVIQVILERQTCWVRPLGMVTVRIEPEGIALAEVKHSPSLTATCCENTGYGKETDPEKVVHDLRQASDLLLPMHLFQPAFDLDVLPLLAQPVRSEMSEETEAQAQFRLNQFVRQLWESGSATLQPPKNDT